MTDKAKDQDVVTAFRQLAQDLISIRNMWIQGDLKARELESQDVGPETGGYERMIRGDARDGIARNLAVLKLDSSPLRLVQANVGQNLEARLLRALSDSDLDAYLPDKYGHSTTRWRQSWAQTGLDPEFEELIALLRSEAEKIDPPPCGSRTSSDETLARSPEALRALQVLHSLGALPRRRIKIPATKVALKLGKKVPATNKLLLRQVDKGRAKSDHDGYWLTTSGVEAIENEIDVENR